MKPLHEPLYKCQCSYKTHDKYKMRQHLNRKTPCVPGQDMSTVDINSLLIRAKQLEDLSHLSIEEKRLRMNQQTNKITLRRGATGGKTTLEYVKYILNHMKAACIKRKHNPPVFTAETLLELLQNNKVYKSGPVEIPLLLTNGYINSASVDRIDNSKGYTHDNVRIIPRFLNVEDVKMSKINPEDWDEIMTFRELPRDIKEFSEIANIIKNNYISKTFFYGLANSASDHIKNSKNKNLIFDFGSLGECAIHLINKFKEQGGRCAYLKIPIHPIECHKYKASIERINHNIGYTRNNIVLIVSSINASPSGPKNSETGALGLNLDKLNEWVLLTKEKELIINDLIKSERSNLELLFKEIDLESKLKIYTSKYKGICVKDGKFVVRIPYNNKRHYIGAFKNEDDAARAYNKKAIEFYGSDAKLLIIE